MPGNPSKASNSSLYKLLIEKIFLDRYAEGMTEVPFQRSDIEDAATTLNVRLPKNLGDLVYSFRYRRPMPDPILKTQTEGHEWVIEGAGRARYLFSLVRVKPNYSQPEFGDHQAARRHARNRFGLLTLGRTSPSRQRTSCLTQVYQ